MMPVVPSPGPSGWVKHTQIQTTNLKSSVTRLRVVVVCPNTHTIPRPLHSPPLLPSPTPASSPLPSPFHVILAPLLRTRAATGTPESGAAGHVAASAPPRFRTVAPASGSPAPPPNRHKPLSQAAQPVANRRSRPPTVATDPWEHSVGA
eukprot:2485008-Rhodomonas_salina.1